MGLAADPAFSMDSVTPRIEKVNKLYKKVLGKKKPKEKKPKIDLSNTNEDNKEKNDYEKEEDLWITRRILGLFCL